MSLITLVGTFVLLFTAVFTETTADLDPSTANEYGSHFEGDMILTDDQIDDVLAPLRNGINGKKFRWPNKIVPYQMSPNHTQEQQNFIVEGLRKIESVSCIRFVRRRTNEKHYIQLEAGPGCSSYVGYQKGVQVVNFQPTPINQGCFTSGTILHEFLHALGFYHMHNAPDRDQYIKINWENMPDKKKYDFIQYSFDKDFDVSSFGETYDYNSVLHINSLAYSINGRPTVEPTDPRYLHVIGQRIGMSKKDILKLNKMYQCDMSSLVFPPETEQVERLVDNPNVEVGEEPETTEEVTTEITTEAAPQEKPQRPVKKPDDNWYDKPYLIQSAISLRDNGFIDLTDAEFEQKDNIELLDLIIKGLKKYKDKVPEDLQRQIEDFENERKLYN